MDGGGGAVLENHSPCTAELMETLTDLKSVFLFFQLAAGSPRDKSSRVESVLKQVLET